MDLQSAFDATTKILFGQEIGKLESYERYLSRYVEPVIGKTSSLSGKHVFFSTDEYPASSNFISYDEIPVFKAKFADFKLGINQMKDFDSILQAIGEISYYCGDAVLGNSQNVRESNRCFNSVNVFRSQEIYDSKYVAYSSVARFAECLFGCNGIGETKFAIKNYSTYQNTRCFECDVIYTSSDCYYSATIANCTNCIFCFNLRNRNHSIGNVPLPKDQYSKIKESLLEQMRLELERKKELPGIVGLLESIGRARAAAKGKHRQGKETRPSPTKQDVPIRELDSSFAGATKILLGKARPNLLAYREWLYRNVQQVISVPSVLSGKMVYTEPLKYNLFACPQEIFVKLDESLKLAESKIGEEELSGLALQNAPAMLEKIAYMTPEAEVGMNINVAACAAYGYAINALGCWWPVKTKNAAYCGWSRQSESTFGCSIIFSSKFCIKCFNSVNLNRCFEVSDSDSCSDCYFCHNCENVENGIFCFNAKALRYAVGNTEVGKEEFTRIKKILLDRINKELDEKNSCSLSIFAIPSGKKL